MTKHRPAPRWVEFDFLGQAETQHPERYRLRLDANLIHSWHVTYVDDEPDTSVCVVFCGVRIVFPGKNPTDEPQLGSVMVDLIDYGEHLAPTINDMIYEARHPWLDAKDARKKKVFNIESISENMLLRAKDGRYSIISESSLADSPINPYWLSLLAFKPINPAEYYRFTHVEAWKG